MNRLQKKCFVAAAGSHLLVLVVLLCSGFITTKPKTDDSQVLDVIPANLIDAAFNSGLKGAKPPPPAPIIKPPEPQPQPQPPPPKPEVKPVEPVKQPDEVKPAEIPEPKPKPQPHKIEVDLTKKVVRKPTEAPDDAAEQRKAAEAAAKAAKEAKRLHDQRVKAIQNAAHFIRENTSSSMNIEMPENLAGDSKVAYANYGSIIKSVYTQAWTPPDNADNDEANVKVSVTIANNGRVISARIVERSGDSNVDRSVQRTLDRVTEIAPFPDGATDKERTYIVNFNLKAKRMLG